MVSFSVVRNWYRLVTESGSEVSRDLRPIHAIRLFTMFCVIMGHCGLFINLMPSFNPQYMERVSWGMKWQVWPKIYIYCSISHIVLPSSNNAAHYKWSNDYSNFLCHLWIFVVDTVHEIATTEIIFHSLFMEIDFKSIFKVCDLKIFKDENR